MGKLGRDLYRRRLENLLSHSVDEPFVTLVTAASIILAGNAGPVQFLLDMPQEAVGADLSSRYYVAPWLRETLINELLSTPKAPGHGTPGSRFLRSDRYAILLQAAHYLIKLENAEDGIFLKHNDVLDEVPRLAQRQFHWQRGVANAPHLYRSMLLYGSGTAAEHFQESAGLSVADFVKVGTCLYAEFDRSLVSNRDRDLSAVGVTPELREAALKKFAIAHSEARVRTGAMRSRRRNRSGDRILDRHTAYRPSILRDHPVIAFGRRGERLRAPLPELIMYRYTSGLYLDAVAGGSAVWTGIGERFETYTREYLEAMMPPYKVEGEREYGPKKRRFRTPDVLVSEPNGNVVVAIECKAKRMTFDARFADDPVGEDAYGFDELAKGVFQVWRFFAHARRGLVDPLSVSSDCQGMVVTADSWLTMARNQADQVIDNAHRLADQAGGIEVGDRRDIAFCQIDDVERALQHAGPELFLTLSREAATRKNRGLMLPISVTTSVEPRPYPFAGRIAELIPWLSSTD